MAEWGEEEGRDREQGGCARLEYVEVLSGEGANTHWRCVFCKKEHTAGGS